MDPTGLNIQSSLRFDMHGMGRLIQHCHLIKALGHYNKYKLEYESE